MHRKEVKATPAQVDELQSLQRSLDDEEEIVLSVLVAPTAEPEEREHETIIAIKKQRSQAA